MQKLVAVLLALALFLVPLAASAQTAAPAVPAPMQAPVKADTVLGLTSGQVVAIGIGVVGGIIIAEALLTTHTATYAGALVGGLIGNWWFDQNGAIRPR